MTSEPADSLKAAIPTDAQAIATQEISGSMLHAHDPHESIDTCKRDFPVRKVPRDWEKARRILAAALR